MIVLATNFYKLHLLKPDFLIHGKVVSFRPLCKHQTSSIRMEVLGGLGMLLCFYALLSFEFYCVHMSTNLIIGGLLADKLNSY